MLKANRNCIGFAFLRRVIGPEKSHHSLNQSDSKLTASQDLVTSVFPRFMQFTWFYFELPLAPYYIFPSFWLAAEITPVLALRHSIEKRSNSKLYVGFKV